MDWDRSRRLLEIPIAWNDKIIFLLFCGRTIQWERGARPDAGSCITNYRDMSRTSRKFVTETGRVNLQYRLPRPVAMLLWACSFSRGENGGSDLKDSIAHWYKTQLYWYFSNLCEDRKKICKRVQHNISIITACDIQVEGVRPRGFLY